MVVRNLNCFFVSFRKEIEGLDKFYNVLEESGRNNIIFDRNYFDSFWFCYWICSIKYGVEESLGIDMC